MCKQSYSNGRVPWRSRGALLWSLGLTLVAGPCPSRGAFFYRSCTKHSHEIMFYYVHDCRRCRYLYSFDINFDFDVKDLNRFNYGANLGVGIDLAFLTVDVTYEIGLKDYFQNAEGRNNMLTASVGIKF